MHLPHNTVITALSGNVVGLSVDQHRWMLALGSAGVSAPLHELLYLFQAFSNGNWMPGNKFLVNTFASLILSFLQSEQFSFETCRKPSSEWTPPSRKQQESNGTLNVSVPTCSNIITWSPITPELPVTLGRSINSLSLLGWGPFLTYQLHRQRQPDFQCPSWLLCRAERGPQNIQILAER